MSEIVFSINAKNFCKDILSNAFYIKNSSIQLRDELMKMGIITDEDTFVSVSNNVKLKLALLKNISIELSQDLNQSRYGMNIVSDFDLFHNMATDKEFLDFLMKSKRFDVADVNQYSKLKKNRSNLRQWLLRIRNNVILDFELPETPMTIIENKKKKAKTVEDVQLEVKMDLEKAKQRSMDQDFIDDDDENLSDLHGGEFDFIHKKNADIMMENQANPPTELCLPYTGDNNDVYHIKRENEIEDVVRRLRLLFKEFSEGGTLLIKLNSLDSVGVPGAVKVAITKHKAFENWEGTANINLNYQGEEFFNSYK
jgi:hypothetical protein